jgi:hypothetical protein
MNKNKEYQNMNASEKTKFMGFKHYSEKELNQLQLDNEKRRVSLFRHLLEELLAIKNLRLGKHLSDVELSDTFSKMINDFYYWTVDNGYTGEDLKSVVDNLVWIQQLVERSHRQVGIEETKFNYAITGENDLGNLPIKQLMALAELGMGTRPDEPVVDEDQAENLPTPEPEEEV